MFIETLSSTAKNIEISRNLFEKRKRDIREAAEEVSYSDHLSERKKLELLMKSVKIQDRPELMEFDGYLNWTDSNLSTEKQSHVSLLSAWEMTSFANKDNITLDEQALYSLTLLKHNVRRYFLKKKVVSRNPTPTTVSSRDYIGLLQALLMKTFHPQICVKLDPETRDTLLVHSVQLTENPAVRVPLAVVEHVKEITPEHVEYSLRWSSAGEKIAKAIIKIIKDDLE